MRFIPPNATMCDTRWRPVIDGPVHGLLRGDEAALFKGYEAGQAADATDERRSLIQPGCAMEVAYGGESVIDIVVEHTIEVIEQGLVEGFIHFDDPMRKTKAPCHAL